MKQARSLAILQESFTFELSGVARDREMNFLPPGLCEIQTGKLICGPIGAVMKAPPSAGVHQGKLDLPGDVGTVNRPVTALHLAVNRADHAKGNPRDDENQTESSLIVHGTHSSWHLPCRLENIGVFQPDQLVQRQILKSVLARLLNEFRRDPLYFGADNFVAAQALESGGLQRFHILRRDTLNFHRDDLI